MGFVKEFKEFAVKGNVVDMAVGIIIGGGFWKKVFSVVADVIMPPIGLLLGGVDFSGLKITLKEAQGEIAAVTLNYGLFIQTVVNFTIVAFAVFLLVKGINTLRRQQEKAPPAPPKTPEDILLLREIRDSLNKYSPIS